MAGAWGATFRRLPGAVAGGAQPFLRRRRMVERATPKRLAKAVTLREVGIGVGSAVDSGSAIATSKAGCGGRASVRMSGRPAAALPFSPSVERGLGERQDLL